MLYVSSGRPMVEQRALCVARSARWRGVPRLKYPGGQPLSRRVHCTPEGSHYPGGYTVPRRAATTHEGHNAPGWGSHRRHRRSPPARAGLSPDFSGHSRRGSGDAPSPRMGRGVARSVGVRVQAVASHAGGSTGFAQKLKETALLRQYERANERVFVQSRFNPRLAGASRHRRSPLATPDERGRADDPAWWADHAATGGGVYLARWYYRRVARFPARFAPAPHLAAARPGQTGHRPGARAPGEDRRNLQRPSGGVARWCDAGHDVRRIGRPPALL